MDLIDYGVFIAVGLLAGTLAASLGLGGGVVFVPALVALMSFDQHLAQGTSLAVILPTAVVGMIGHSRRGRVVWPVAGALAAAGIVAGLIGARLALKLEAVVLQRMFATLLLVLAANMVVRTYRMVRSAHRAGPSP